MPSTSEPGARPRSPDQRPRRCRGRDQISALSENLEKRAFYAAFSKAAISAPPDRPNNRFSPEWPINRGLAVEMALRGRNDGTSATTVLPALGAWKPAKDAGFHIPTATATAAVKSDKLLKPA